MDTHSDVLTTSTALTTSHDRPLVNRSVINAPNLEESIKGGQVQKILVEPPDLERLGKGARFLTVFYTVIPPACGTSASSSRATS